MHVPIEYIRDQVALALQEDIGTGDVTAKLLDSNISVQAELISREAAILCGRQWFDEVLHQLSRDIEIDWQLKDGDPCAANQLLCKISGPAQAILTGERTALNFLQTLSGTATATRQYVDAMANTRTKLLDTRKTIPGLRLAQKYAVRCGGGHNHRIGLYDMILIKENHIQACGSIADAIMQAQSQYPDLASEVEVETLEQLEAAIDAGATRILLDNFTLEMLVLAVSITAGRAELEASGNITLENIRTIAATGVDYISTGAITKHVRAIDLSLRITSPGR